MLVIVASYQRNQFQGQIMIQTRENGEKPHFRLDLDPLDLNSDRQTFFIKPVGRHCSKLSFYVIQRKTSEPSSRKWRKT